MTNTNQDNPTIGRKNAISARHLEIFAAVMRAHSMVGAAQQLSISQPAVSAAIKQLETHRKRRCKTRPR